MSYFVHALGCCESDKIGAGTRIWAFAHVLAGARVGEECNICDHVFIENQVVIGDHVTVKCGVQLWDGMTVENNVFIGPNATFSNDLFPRSKKHPQRFLTTRICQGASVGANATILPGIIIGRNAMVGAGAVVTRSVPPNAIVVGNPARIVGYVDSLGKISSEDTLGLPQANSSIELNVPGVTLHRLSLVEDLRGNLTAGEFMRQVPFAVNRYFVVFDVPSAETRGAHAHRRCHQFLVCLKGSVAFVADNGEKRQEITLDRPDIGLYLPPMIWGVQYKYSEDAMLLVLASDYYDNSDYIRDYEEFLTLRRQQYS